MNPFPRIWCCLASVHPFANWDVTTSLHHQLCPSQSAQSGGARHVLENVLYHDKNKFLFWGAEQKLTTIRFVELAHKNICQKNVRWKILERKELPIIYFWVLEMAKEPSPISDSLETREPGRFFFETFQNRRSISECTSKNYHATYKKCRFGRWFSFPKWGFPMISIVFCSGVPRINRWKISPGGGGTVKHLKIFRLIYHSALETTALPPMRKPEMEAWRDHLHGWTHVLL